MTPLNDCRAVVCMCLVCLRSICASHMLGGNGLVVDAMTSRVSV
jgi:hypothetical protein